MRYTGVLKRFCSMIDRIVLAFDAEAFEVNVDEHDMSVCMGILFKSIEVTGENEDHGLHDLIEKAMSFAIEFEDEDHVLLKLIYPSVWEPVNE